jgi:hypothetical protein
MIFGPALYFLDDYLSDAAAMEDAIEPCFEEGSPWERRSAVVNRVLMVMPVAIASLPSPGKDP